jgi:hypothetical protein
MVQQTTRVRAADGSERISGVAGEAFLSGQRHAAMHIAFCPPFEKTPELEFEQIDGPTARIKVGQLQPYGARLDLRLARAGKDSQRVVVQFEARKLA